MDRACFVCRRFISSRLWWAQVTVTPEARRTAVFNRGTEKGLIGEIPVGGHVQPISGVGASLLWKNAQKNAKKNITSEMMNRINPIRRPVATGVVCLPINVPSRITSRHHWIIERLIMISPRMIPVIEFLWNQVTSPNARVRAPREEVSGQGLRWTRWKGWRIIFMCRRSTHWWLTLCLVFICSTFIGRVMGFNTWKVFVMFILPMPRGFSHFQVLNLVHYFLPP